MTSEYERLRAMTSNDVDDVANSDDRAKDSEDKPYFKQAYSVNSSLHWFTHSGLTLEEEYVYSLKWVNVCTVQNLGPYILLWRPAD